MTRKRALRIACYALLSVTLVSAAVLLGSTVRKSPRLCEPPLVARGPHCCAEGQRVTPRGCEGAPDTCGPLLAVAGEPHPGCMVRHRRVPIPAGSVQVGAGDWEATGERPARTVSADALSMDRGEVNGYRWQRCVRAGRCAKAQAPLRPGVPVVDISPDDAAAFCAFEGGRLPTTEEWIFAAAGLEARRFPWGNTGLVCRRASYGLVDGPCASGAVSPPLGGSRPSGATPHGLLDMAGNVAEWTADGEGRFSAMGGSYRSRVAGELKSWSRRPHAEPGPDVGFRCVYDE